jgi:5-methylcytosine-specific restriction protein A
MDSLDIHIYRDKLIDYLKSTKYLRNADQQKVQKFVDAIEVDLLEVIRSNQHVDLQEIYEYTDKDALEELINMTNRGRSLAAQNEQSDGLLREAIDYYLGYLDSKKHPLSEVEKRNRKKNPPQGNSGSSSQTPSYTSTPEPIKKPEPDPDPEPETYDKLEGAKHQDTVTRYERDRGNRKDCIAHYGYVCQICEMNFEKTYGEIGKDFIEVHHLHPVSQGERQVNPIEDLIPLCSNCHSMIHRQEDVSDWKGLKEIYIQNQTNGHNNEEVHN